ncbi:MAG: hypothetical protein ACP5HZ_05715 [Ferrimicrobium sp.]
MAAALSGGIAPLIKGQLGAFSLSHPVGRGNGNPIVRWRYRKPDIATWWPPLPGISITLAIGGREDSKS